MRSGFVAILGWTNVGKSTLLNRLIGEKVAAVADVAQTTRNRITGVLNVHGRGQIGFVDTPGFHRPKYRMNRAMVQTARDVARDVNVAILMVDAAHGLGPGDREIAQLVRSCPVPRIAVLNKIDLVRPKSKLLPMLQTVVDDWDFGDGIPVSASTGDGCDRLIERILTVLPEAAPPFPDDYLTDQTERVLVSEFIRERLLHATRQELPHSIAVMVESWDDDPSSGLTNVLVSVLVERESQKGIVIGKGGEVLKRVGTEARRDLEALLGRRLYLELRVKVRQDWRNDEAILHRLGIS